MKNIKIPILLFLLIGVSIGIYFLINSDKPISQQKAISTIKSQPKIKEKPLNNGICIDSSQCLDGKSCIAFGRNPKYGECMKEPLGCHSELIGNVIETRCTDAWPKNSSN